MRPDLTILAQRFWPDNYGGVEGYLWNLSCGMVARGLRVHVIAENRTQSPTQESPRPGLSIRRVEPMDAGRLWRWYNAVRLSWWVRVIRAHVPPGRIWATEPIGAAAAILAGRRDDLIHNPACCTAGMDLVGRRYPHVTTMRCSLGIRLLDRFAYQHAPHVVLSSANLRQQFKQAFGGRPGVHVVPHGVHMPATVDRAAIRRRWELDANAFVVGFVGRLDPCKGLDFLFEAFRQANIPEAKLLLVGHGPDRQRLNTIAQNLGLTDRIVWTGKLANANEALPAMNVMVLPSVYEAFGNVVLESMAAGVPVIGRRRDASLERPVLTATEELIEDGRTGLCVDPHNPTDLARVLASLAAHPLGCASLGRQARRAMRSYAWNELIRHDMALLGLRPQEELRAAA